jgi:hypothetical protein
MLQYNTTLARIQLDNGLTNPLKPLKVGQQLLITCNTGYWSGIFGLQGSRNHSHAMVAAPAELVCSGGYMVQLAIKASKVGHARTASVCMQQGKHHSPAKKCFAKRHGVVHLAAHLHVACMSCRSGSMHSTSFKLYSLGACGSITLTTGCDCI